MKIKLITEGVMSGFKKQRKRHKIILLETKMEGLLGGVQVLLHFQLMIRDLNYHNSKI